MYAKTNRKIDERDIQRFEDQFEKQVAEYKDAKRGASCMFFGCLGMMAVVAGILYFFLHANPEARSAIVWCFFIYGAIHGWSVLEELYKDKERDEKEAREIRAAIPTGYVIERHIVSSRCFAIESGQGHAYTKKYYFDTGHQGTLAVDHSLNSDQTLLSFRDSTGREFDSIIVRKGESLSPTVIFSGEKLKDVPDIDVITRAHSFRVLPEPFEELLQRLRTAYDDGETA